MRTKRVSPSGSWGSYTLYVEVPKQYEKDDWKQLDALVDKILERIVPKNRLKSKK